MRKIYTGAIVATNQQAGGKFFDRATLRFFNDVPGNWDAWQTDDGARTFIRNARHNSGSGCFSACTLRGQWREVFEYGAAIGMPIKEADGLPPRKFAAWLAEHPEPFV